MNRRSFLAVSAVSQTRVPGANDRLRGAVIGSGGRGRFLVSQFKELGVEMAAVCDVYQPNLEAGVKAASPGAAGYRDYRNMLEDKSIDVVVVASPDHWHARMVVDAVNAGKDVYVEKPLAHKIEEGFEIIDAVRRTRRIVQVGTQRRSSDFFIEAKSILDSGQLGPIHLVTSQWLNHQSSLVSRKLQGELDWKAWLGSAPERELDATRFFNWYYFWDYSGGLLIGQAAHMIDAIQWMMKAQAPSAVTCAGGKVNLPGAEVPETASVILEYAAENFIATFTLGYKAMQYHMYNDQVKQFHGAKARLDVGREWYRLYPQTLDRTMTVSRQQSKPGAFNLATIQHIRNFMECVHSRNEPTAPVEAGQATNIALCMAMDSLRQGRRLRWNAVRRRVET